MIMDAETLVIGVDPASGKKSWVFAPRIQHRGSEWVPVSPGEVGTDGAYSVEELRGLVRAASNEGWLVCWDAPLSGPHHDQSNHLLAPWSLAKSARTTRRVEEVGFWRELSRALDIKNPLDQEGVSIRGFSQLSHWVISRELLGLPRVGPYDASVECLPLRPLYSDDVSERAGGGVVEVHPALAAYLWLRGVDWHPYKGKGMTVGKASDAVHRMWEILANAVGLDPELVARPFLGTPGQHSDGFDARVAWMLGRQWLLPEDPIVGTPRQVRFVGNERAGGFLLPCLTDGDAAVLAW